MLAKSCEAVHDGDIFFPKKASSNEKRNASSLPCWRPWPVTPSFPCLSLPLSPNVASPPFPTSSKEEKDVTKGLLGRREEKKAKAKSLGGWGGGGAQHKNESIEGLFFVSRETGRYARE